MNNENVKDNFDKVVVNKNIKNAVFTIVSLNYLSMARTLGDSLKKTNPELEFIVLIVDKIKNRSSINEKNFKTFLLEDLRIPNLDEMLFQYNVTELNTAVKPFFAKFLIQNNNYEKIIYLDPDIKVYNSLDDIISKLDEHNVVVTPHVLSSIPDDGKHPNEVEIMQVGCYNLGFIAFKNNPEVIGFLNWWSEKLRNHCFSEPEYGLFTDQKWIDLAPSFLDKVFVLRDKGYNVAYWNLHERNNFTEKNNIKYINNVPLIFYHYSGLLIEDLNKISKFQDRFTLDNFNDVLLKMFKEYKDDLIKNDFLITKKNNYGFGYFDNGIQIKDVIRKIYYHNKKENTFGNPFETVSQNSFFEWLNKPWKKNTSITNLLYGIYELRDDLKKTFPDINKNNLSILQWGRYSLKYGYNLDQAFIDPLGNEKSTSGIIKNIIYKIINTLNKSFFKNALKSFIGEKKFNHLKILISNFLYGSSSQKEIVGGIKEINTADVQVKLFDDLNKKFKNVKYNNSLVLFRPHGIGDLIMSLPSFQQFRRIHKNQYIILYVYEESYKLMAQFPFFDEVISLPRSFNYDQKLDLVPRPKGSIFYNLMSELQIGPSGNNLDNDNNKKYRNDVIATELGLSPLFEKVSIPSNLEAKKSVEKLLSKFPSIDRDNLIVVTFEASNPIRTWDPAYYNIFLSYVLSQGFSVVMVGKKNRNENLFLQHDNFINTIGMMDDVVEVMELVKMAKFVISVDTYLYHFAAFNDIPFLAIFTGGVDPKSRLSYYDNNVSIEPPIVCRSWDMPCPHKADSRGVKICASSLTPQMVINSFNSLLIKNNFKIK